MCPSSCVRVQTAQRWKEMQRVLTDPSTLFWNRTSRATRLYKQGEYELACDSYETALNHMGAMSTPPPAENRATVYFNYGRSAQSAGRLCRGVELFNEVLDATPRHERALDCRAECALGVPYARRRVRTSADCHSFVPLPSLTRNVRAWCAYRPRRP